MSRSDGCRVRCEEAKADPDPLVDAAAGGGPEMPRLPKSLVVVMSRRRLWTLSLSSSTNISGTLYHPLYAWPFDTASIELGRSSSIIRRSDFPGRVLHPLFFPAIDAGAGAILPYSGPEAIGVHDATIRSPKGSQTCSFVCRLESARPMYILQAS